jgi:hypothetical protein
VTQLVSKCCWHNCVHICMYAFAHAHVLQQLAITAAGAERWSAEYFCWNFLHVSLSTARVPH